MLLPNAERAEIDAEKLRGYLLSPTHPVGRFKARFFAALGYSADEWQTLEADLRIQHLSQDAEPGPVTPYGTHDSGYPERTQRGLRPRGERLVYRDVHAEATLRDGVSRRRTVTLHPLDIVVLTHDLPTHGLRAGDLGAVVEVHGPDAIGVEFVAASGRTKALVTLQLQDLREADDDDLVTVRPSSASTNRRDG